MEMTLQQAASQRGAAPVGEEAVNPRRGDLKAAVEASVAAAARCRAGCVPLLISYDMYRNPDYDELQHDELVESERCGRCAISGLTFLIRVVNLVTVACGVAILGLGFWMTDFLNDNRASMDIQIQMAFMHLIVLAIGVLYLAFPCVLGPTFCLTPNLICACFGESGREKARVVSALLKYALAFVAGVLGVLGVLTAYASRALDVFLADPVFSVVYELFDEQFRGYNVSTQESYLGAWLSAQPGFAVGCYLAMIVPCLQLLLLGVHHVADGIWIGRIAEKEVRRSHIDVKRMVLGHDGARKLLEQMQADAEKDRQREKEMLAKKKKKQKDDKGASVAVEGLTRLHEIRVASSAKSRLQMKQALNAARQRRRASMDEMVDEMAEISAALGQQHDESQQALLRERLSYLQEQHASAGATDMATAQTAAALSDGQEETALLESPQPAHSTTMQPKQWACPSCTLLNQDGVLVCALCEGPRPQETTATAVDHSISNAIAKKQNNSTANERNQSMNRDPAPINAARNSPSSRVHRPNPNQVVPLLQLAEGACRTSQEEEPSRSHNPSHSKDAVRRGRESPNGDLSCASPAHRGDDAKRDEKRTGAVDVRLITPRKLRQKRLDDAAAASKAAGIDAKAATNAESGRRKLSKRACVTCGVRQRSIVLLPCRHFCLCDECCSQLQNDPHTQQVLQYKRTMFVRKMQSENGNSAGQPGGIAGNTDLLDDVGQELKQELERRFAKGGFACPVCDTEVDTHVAVFA